MADVNVNNPGFMIFGAHNLSQSSTGRVIANIETFIRHPQYSESAFDYDFALVSIANPLDFTASWKYQPVCLPDSCSDSW